MEKTKRYKWLKLQNNFFEQTAIKKLRRLAGGDTFTIIYLKMQLLSLENDGVIVFENIEDSFEEELALRLDESAEDVQMTVLFLKSCSLVEEISDTEHLLHETIKNIGSESDSAARVRNFRERKKLDTALQSNASPLLCNSDVTACNTEKEKRESKSRVIKNSCANSADALFSRLWELYPVKRGKSAVKTSQRQKLLKIGYDELSRAVERYISEQQKKGTDINFYKQGGTFFNGGYVDYLDENYTALPSDKRKGEIDYSNQEMF